MSNISKTAQEIFEDLEKIRNERLSKEKEIEDIKAQLRSLMPRVNELIESISTLKDEETKLNEKFIEAQSVELKEKLKMTTLKELLNPDGALVKKVSTTVNNLMNPYQAEYEQYCQGCQKDGLNPSKYEDFVKEFSQVDQNMIAKNINPIIGKGNALIKGLLRQIKDKIELENHDVLHTDVSSISMSENSKNNESITSLDKNSTQFISQIDKKEMLIQWISEKNINYKKIENSTIQELHQEYKIYVAQYYQKDVANLNKDEIFLSSKSFKDNLEQNHIKRKITRKP